MRDQGTGRSEVGGGVLHIHLSLANIMFNCWFTYWPLTDKPFLRMRRRILLQVYCCKFYRQFELRKTLLDIKLCTFSVQSCDWQVYREESWYWWGWWWRTLLEYVLRWRQILCFVHTESSNLFDCRHQLGASERPGRGHVTTADQWGKGHGGDWSQACANIIQKCHPYLGSWDCFNSSSSLSIRLIYCPRHHHHHYRSLQVDHSNQPSDHSYSLPVRQGEVTVAIQSGPA